MNRGRFIDACVAFSGIARIHLCHCLPMANTEIEDRITVKVAIIGARRSRNGIGEFIAKYFHKNAATVISVLGTTKETAQNASSALRKYGIESAPYRNFYEMVEREKPDTAVIASPSLTHYEYLVKCIDFGLNIFCEKPFIWRETGDIRGITENIFEKASQENLTLAMNSQWPFSIKYFEEICGRIDNEKTDTFSISLSPLSFGKEMIPESVPHALSMLYVVLGDGEIADLCFEPDAEKMIIGFRYLSKTNDCDVLINLVRKEQQPRGFCFGFNDRIVHRILDFKKYEIYFSYKDKKKKIMDPLELSVQDFIEAVREQREPLIGYSHILNNMSLLRKIYDSYPGI